MKSHKLLVLGYMSDGGTKPSSLTSQIISYDSYDEAEEAYGALKASSPRGGCYLVVFRCYDISEG